MKITWAILGALWLQGAPAAVPADRHGAGRTQDDFLFDEISQRWLKRNEVETAKDWNALLEQRFTHFALGLFDVYLPAESLRETKAWKDASAGLSGLLDAQEGLRNWFAGAPPDEKATESLAKWLSGLTPKALGNRPAAGADLLDLAEADDEIRAALESYRTEFRSGKSFGIERKLPAVRLVMFPLRGEFVEFTSVVGLLDARLKSTAWNEGIGTWLEYLAWDTRFVTLEYAAEEGSKDFNRGVSVGARNPAAVGELVSQVACRALFAKLFSEGLDPALSSGMANALVIDLYNELDTRIDGDVRSRSSQGSSVFVPGGNPNGGFLPPTSAENRWRGTKGKDHFVGILSQVQKQSGRKANTKAGKITRFEMQSLDGSTKEMVSAPFLGPKAIKPGDEVFGDYLELVRCYGVAFLHWLRLEGAGEAESGARFADFLRKLAKGAKTSDLPKVFEQLYGQPLSAGTAEELFTTPTLEGRFLTWLAK